MKIISKRAVKKDGIISLLKAKKNEVQQQGMRDANVRDCAAIMKYFAFLEEELKKPDHGLDEFSGSQKVAAFRATGDKFVSLSFEAISSIGPNGAVIHYAPKGDGTAGKMNAD